jgi:predicted dehydrogenase
MLRHAQIQADESKDVPRRSRGRRSAPALSAGTALSYSRILGANDRISLGHIGCGRRGLGLQTIARGLKGRNLEMTAVCDLWKVNREAAAARTESWYGRAPRSFQYMEDLLALKDVDAVLISTADFQHATHLKAVVEAGKDAYCEKPMANDLAEAKAARDAVLRSDRIVQVGTQHRSEPYQIAARELIKSGALGDVSKVEIVWNYHGPRWRGREEVAQLREADTDWRRWLLGKPYRPFDPRMYFEFRLYKDFSSGIADQWMSHGIDLVHYFLEDEFPRSVMASGGVFAWKDGRENPDTFQALLEYPKGFLVSYCHELRQRLGQLHPHHGQERDPREHRGRRQPALEVGRGEGTHESDPDVKRAERYVTLPGDDRIPPTSISDDDLSHMTNWIECLRSRKAPNATVRHGFAHSVACIMAARAYREGRKLYWDPNTESILDHPAETAT